MEISTTYDFILGLLLLLNVRNTHKIFFHITLISKNLNGKCEKLCIILTAQELEWNQ